MILLATFPSVTELLQRQHERGRIYPGQRTAVSPLEWGGHGGGGMEVELPTFKQTINTDNSAGSRARIHKLKAYS